MWNFLSISVKESPLFLPKGLYVEIQKNKWFLETHAGFKLIDIFNRIHIYHFLFLNQKINNNVRQKVQHNMHIKCFETCN